MKRFMTFTVVLLAAITLSFGQTVVNDSGRNMMEMLKKLSDDSMQGRLGGQPGATMAAEYIVGKLKSWGVQPAGDNGTWLQKYPLKDKFLVKPGLSFSLDLGNGPQSFYYQERNMDWSVIDFSGSGRVDAEIVFVGYGLYAPDKGYNDYEGVDVKGKVVIFCHDHPTMATDKMEAEASIEARLAAAHKLGAAAVILFATPGNPWQQPPMYFPMVRLEKSAYQKDLPIIGISQKILSFMFDDQGQDPAGTLKGIDKAKKPNSFPIGVKASLNVQTEYLENRVGINVLGKIAGTDGKLKNEYVLFGGHMDHLGVGPDGKVYNGADDNGSGTVSVMEAARVMKSTGFKPKRTVIFALWGGEEEGLVGSSYYANHPLYSLDKTVANINLDCNGLGNKVQIGGIYYGAEIWEYLKKNLDPKMIEDVANSGAGGGSDHISFFLKGVPAFHFVTFGEEGGRIHHQRDDWDLINADILEKSFKLAYECGVLLAQGPATLINPGRKEIIKFRSETIVDYRGADIADILARPAVGDYQDVDFRLVTLEGDRSKSGAEYAIDIINKSGKMGKDVRGRRDVKLFSIDNDLFMGGWRTKLVIGLKNASVLGGVPETLLPLIKGSIYFVVFSPEDLLQTDGKISATGKALLLTLGQNGIAVVLRGFPAEGLKEVLGAVNMSPVVVGKELPSVENVELIKKTNAVFGLEFLAGEKAADYGARLKAAVALLGAERLTIWNDDDPGNDAVKAAYRSLFSLTAGETWNAAAPDRVNAMTREGISGLLSGNFMELLYRVRTSAR